MTLYISLVSNSQEDRYFQAYLHSLGCTHLLVRTDLYLKYLHDNYPPETANRLLQRMNKATEVIYNAGGYKIYRLIIPGQSPL